MIKIFFILIGVSLLLSSCGEQDQKEQQGSGEVISTIHEMSENLLPTNPGALEGVGTEPFWAFRFAGTKLVWQTPSLLGSGPETTSHQVVSYKNSQNGNIILSGSGIEVILTPARCTDGMSSNVYNYIAQVQLESSKYDGCARPFVKR